ncbi:hypothetical protein KDA11_01490 [Candidatus Saccharibacteria bacterium]|nr:hypothetical protein [Candidatus Saccharibacteria bacterium]
MTKKAKTSKRNIKLRNSITSDTGNISASAASLFGGSAVVLIGILQQNDNLKLLIIGFGSALLVLGGVLAGLATKQDKKKK